MHPSVQTSYRRYEKFLSRARLIQIPGHLVLQTVDLPSYLTYGIRTGILPPKFGYFEWRALIARNRALRDRSPNKNADGRKMRTEGSKTPSSSKAEALLARKRQFEGLAPALE
jgi:hypothetical protein